MYQYSRKHVTPLLADTARVHDSVDQNATLESAMSNPFKDDSTTTSVAEEMKPAGNVSNTLVKSPPKSEPPLLCEHEGCEKRPSCNVRGEIHGRFCGAHKLNGMILKGKLYGGFVLHVN